MHSTALNRAKLLSPKRNSTQAANIDELAKEQLLHFGIDPDSEYGMALYQAACNLYQTQLNVHQLWDITTETLEQASKQDRIAYFNAKKFLSFQLAKVLDTLQNPFRATHQSLNAQSGSHLNKGHYPLFDNVTALFSANPVIVRTATYVYACTEWIDDAFQGKEFSHQIYSRLLNPTSISLANAIVDLEAGPYAGEYMAWNFNSGMAAIDGMLANVLSHGDVVIVSRNIYGGVFQLLQDHYAKPDKMAVKLEWFDGYSADEFQQFMQQVKEKHADKLKAGANLHVYIESPCNPHGYVLDVPGICELAHQQDALVMLDATLATPVLQQSLQYPHKTQRPDYVVHSYTKDICGSGATTAGVVIGENHRMFQAKGDTVNGVSWDKTLFWDVYYIKGAFLDSEKAFDVLMGMKTLEQRIINKVINTKVFTAFLASHPDFNINSHAIEQNKNAHLRRAQLRHGWPCALFTVDMEQADLSRDTFVRFFDALEPGFSHQVSIGQNNTIILCPALTSHSELNTEAQHAAGIYLTTMRIAMGTDNVKQLIAHFMQSAQIHIEPVRPGFCDKFMSAKQIDDLYLEISMQVSQQHFESVASMQTLLEQHDIQGELA
ncbi:aminotransferase class I/II-fold pyridoxal phosphate-dependent enzyme [Neptunicella marina]|uniref:Aminotransferase class I/II-fold pyridoxal phosphate-dependent enzyme n=1 Tax=Neptunicella marina TaxID=2125989 RepID=A0A8J6M0T5_9ALTE|nr:aminotransferase class I/II-fold pyridoxal phosphate-dependent enzyme [Neptunicella marina]MBC3765173.1 aminotransferase class I/II-fold pyridoxal phosphate-dependent enzyme [Neptunicella marina]